MHDNPNVNVILTRNNHHDIGTGPIIELHTRQIRYTVLSGMHRLTLFLDGSLRHLCLDLGGGFLTAKQSGL